MIPTEIAPFIEVKDFIPDAFRLLGMIILKGLAWIVDLLYESIAIVLQLDFLNDLYVKHGAEIRNISIALFTLTLIIFFIIKMYKPNALKEYQIQLIIVLICLSGMSSIVSFVGIATNGLRDYASDINESGTLSNSIVENITVHVPESVRRGKITYFNEAKKKPDILSLNINSASREAPLTQKVVYTLQDGTVISEPLSTPWWAFGNLDESIYMYQINFIWGDIFMIVIIFGLVFSLFKFGRLNFALAFTTVTSLLFVVTDLSGQRTKQIFKDIISLIASIFFMLFAFKLYGDLINIALRQSNLIAKFIYLLVISEFMISLSDWVQRTLRVDTPQIAGQKSMLGRLIMAQALRSGIRSGLKGIRGIGKNGATETNDINNEPDNDSTQTVDDTIDTPNTYNAVHRQQTNSKSENPNVSRPQERQEYAKANSINMKMNIKENDVFGTNQMLNEQSGEVTRKRINNPHRQINPNDIGNLDDMYNVIDESYGDFKMGTKFTVPNSSKENNTSNDIDVENSIDNSNNDYDEENLRRILSKYD